LDAARLKVDRALKDLHAAQAELSHWAESEPYHITVDPDPPTGWHSVRVHIPQPPPANAAAGIGEAAVKLRSALNYVVLQLRKLHPSPIPKKLADGRTPLRAQFPIFRSETEFEGTGRRMIHGVPAQWQAEIKSLQPYDERGNPLPNHPLAIVNRLSNVDKHTDLLPHLYPIPSDEPLHVLFKLPPGIEITEFRANRGALEDDTEVYAFRTNAVGDYTQVLVELDVAFHVAFGEAELGLERLGDLVSEIGAVVRHFEPAFA